MKIFFQSRSYSGLIAISFILNIALYALFSFKIPPSYQPIPLGYNIYFGINKIGPWYMIYLTPAVGTLILLWNTGLALFLDSRNHRFVLFLLCMTLGLELLMLISGFLLILLNISYA